MALWIDPYSGGDVERGARDRGRPGRSGGQGERDRAASGIRTRVTSILLAGSGRVPAAASTRIASSRVPNPVRLAPLRPFDLPADEPTEERHGEGVFPVPVLEDESLLGQLCQHLVDVAVAEGLGVHGA